jgi:hypothetical protein
MEELVRRWRKEANRLLRLWSGTWGEQQSAHLTDGQRLQRERDVTKAITLKDCAVKLKESQKVSA